LKPAVDWRRILRAEIRRAVASVAGSVDYTYRRPSRRASVSDDILLPALYRPQPEIAVVCDTSGSMHDELLARALAEVEGLVAAQGLRRQLRVLAVDTQVHASSRVASARQVTLAGGGGTDMGAGIHAAVALRPAADVIVVLTDGYTPWPHRAPPARVVVGLFDQAGSPSDPPAWARTVRIRAR
jgi:predicted metal-dependent peptidase